MSSSNIKSKICVKKMPLVLKKEKLSVINKGQLALLKDKSANFFKNVVALNNIPGLNRASTQIYQEVVIYESDVGDFLRGEPRNVKIINKQNLSSNASRTVATYTLKNGVTVKKTSDNVTKLIGQDNYNTLFSALCSVISQEFRIRGILSLLTEEKSFADSSFQTDVFRADDLDCVVSKCDISCQTEETRFVNFKKERRRVRRQPSPYVIKDSDEKVGKKLNKVVIYPSRCSSISSLSVKEESLDIDHKAKPTSESLPDLGLLHDDNSRDSIGNYSSLSVEIPGLLKNPDLLLNNIDQHTKDLSANNLLQNLSTTHMITVMDGTSIIVPIKPEDDFHLATKEILQYVSNEDKKRLLRYQAFIDHKYAMIEDSDGYLPLHTAVLNNDVDLVTRQCIVFKMKNTSIDRQVNGMTPLLMSLFEASNTTSVLLQFGADPLATDNDRRTCLHLASELKSEHLHTIVNYCTKNAKTILEDNEDLWKPAYADKTNEELAPILLNHMCQMSDEQGYTPLMLASKIGNYTNVTILCEAAPSVVNKTAPSSGDTALYIAVSAACSYSVERGNKSRVVDHFQLTINQLLEYGANPCIDNHSGSNVNTLLSDLNVPELSMLIANKLTREKYFGGEMEKNFDSFMLIRDESGIVNIKAVKTERDPLKQKRSPPVIVENILFDTPKSVKGKSIANTTVSIAGGSTNNSNTADKNNVFIVTPKHLDRVKINLPVKRKSADSTSGLKPTKTKKAE